MKTIQVQIPIKTVAVYLAALLVLIGLLEIFLRIDLVSSRLTTPSVGSQHHQFEIQLARMEAVYQKQGGIDCIFVGDSLVWLDLNPLKFSEGYKTSSGEEMTCFNFGVAALPASGVSVLTEILVKEYNPKLIIYGLHANSVVVPQDHQDSKVFLDTPWVKYKTGSFNVPGWFYENSYFVRNLETLSRLMRFDPGALQNELGVQPYQLLGFDPKTGQRTDVNVPPSRSNKADSGGFEKYYHYQVYPENISGIQNIARLADRDTRVMMVMMPVNNSFYAFFENGEQDYLQIHQAIEEVLADTDTVLLKTNGKIQLPDSAWWDYSHLNLDGAQEFSYWLGTEIENEGVTH